MKILNSVLFAVLVRVVSFVGLILTAALVPVVLAIVAVVCAVNPYWVFTENLINKFKIYGKR